MKMNLKEIELLMNLAKELSTSVSTVLEATGHPSAVLVGNLVNGVIDVVNHVVDQAQGNQANG